MAQGAKIMPGNVGVGATSSSYKLNVIDDIRATGSVYYGGTDGAPDGNAYTKPNFVFEKDYKAVEIGEIEHFIKKNRRLPWVTSAKKEKKGWLI